MKVCIRSVRDSYEQRCSYLASFDRDTPSDMRELVPLMSDWGLV